MNVRRLLSLVSLVFVAVAARPVLAVCMGAQEYRVSIAGSTLIVIPTIFSRAAAPTRVACFGRMSTRGRW